MEDNKKNVSEETAENSEETVINTEEATDVNTEAAGDSANTVDSQKETKEKEKKKSKKADAEVEKLKNELLDANDKYMRLFAEYENFRKRSAKERESVYADAYIDALTQILPILDNLERAAQYSGEDCEHPLAKGLELVLKSFAETLDKMGVKEIEALGKTFDPNVHNAVMHIDDESFGENEVVEVFMKGYIRGDKVLRHSMVKVAN